LVVTALAPPGRHPLFPWLTLFPRRLDRRWWCLEISISGRASKPARAAHAPESMAGNREAVLAETERATSAGATQAGKG
jgi:hypothetical protein